MHPNVTDLTPQQEQAIELLLMGKPPSHIAEELGIHRQTLWRWRQLPAFAALQRELQQRRQEEIRERFTEVMRLAFVSLERELKLAEDPKKYNPIETALNVIRLMHSVPVLAAPMMSPAPPAPPLLSPPPA